MLNRHVAVAFFVVVFILGCASQRNTRAPLPEIELLNQRLVKTENAPRKTIAPKDSLTLEEAIHRVLEKNSGLKVFLSEVKIREARILQESFIPNPELAIELENFGGSGPFRTFRGSEITLGIGQLIELGSKRSKRMQVATSDTDIALLQHELKRLEIITTVRERFLRVLTAQKKVELENRLVVLSQSFKSNIDTLVKAGRLSQAESARAQVELSNRELFLQKSVRELKISRQRLVASWSLNEADFNAVKGDLQLNITVPNAEKVRLSLERSPVLLQQKAYIRKHKAETDLAGALALPDPVVSAGYRRYNESDDQALIAGVSIPLPFFDRNQGGLQEARFRERQGREQLLDLVVNLDMDITSRLESIRSMVYEIETIGNIIIPEAQKAYGIIQQNYQKGKSNFIEVLDAQRQLFEAREQNLESLTRMHALIIELEGLLGQSLESL